MDLVQLQFRLARSNGRLAKFDGSMPQLVRDLEEDNNRLLRAAIGRQLAHAEERQADVASPCPSLLVLLRTA